MLTSISPFPRFSRPFLSFFVSFFWGDGRGGGGRSLFSSTRFNFCQDVSYSDLRGFFNVVSFCWLDLVKLVTVFAQSSSRLLFMCVRQIQGDFVFEIGM